MSGRHAIQGHQGSAAILKGITREVSMKGAPIMASDLRASAGLVTEGRTDVNRLYYIDCGYEHLDDNLVSLGTQLEHVRE